MAVTLVGSNSLLDMQILPQDPSAYLLEQNGSMTELLTLEHWYCKPEGPSLFQAFR